MGVLAHANKCWGVVVGGWREGFCHISFVVGGGKGKYILHNMQSDCPLFTWRVGQSLSVCIGRRVATVFWVVFFLYKMGRLKDVAREARALMKDLQKKLEAFVIIIVAGFNVVLIYCLRCKCS